jgi:hypothetical protein
MSAAKRAPWLLANFAKNISAAIRTVRHFPIGSVPNVWEQLVPSYGSAVCVALFQRALLLSRLDQSQIVCACVAGWGRVRPNETWDRKSSDDANNYAYGDYP